MRNNRKIIQNFTNNFLNQIKKEVRINQFSCFLTEVKKKIRNDFHKKLFENLIKFFNNFLLKNKL